MPLHGFSRWHPTSPLPEDQTAFRSHDGLLVVSSIVNAELPGSGQPPLVGPTWHVSVSLYGRRSRERPSDEQVQRVVEAFAMPAFDEDNHHPGLARHLFCPLEPQYREACECKAREVVIIEPDGYRWTTEESECRGCWYQERFGLPCTIHSGIKTF